jgi:hypothetical protein
MRQAYCSKCHALIFWGRTKKGKFIPLEEDGLAVPNPGGEVMWDELGNQFKGVPVSSRIPGAVRCFRPHFIFCPYADVMRKPRQKTEWEKLMEQRAADRAAKDAETAARREEKARVAKAQAEFEAMQERLF